MANEINKLNSVTNETDPKVVFDPKIEKTEIKKYIIDRDESSSAVNGHTVPTRVDGVLIPIIKINTQVISENDIISMKLNYTDFLPSIEIIVNKANYLKLSTPGMVNKITLVILPPIDGAYKKISIDFDITSVHDYGNRVRYFGNYFLPELNKKFTKCIKNSKNSLTTYELFEEVAKLTKLGYAVTQQVKEVADSKIRLMRSQNYPQVLQEHLKFSGLNNESIYISWIDLYGYLVLCNVAWVMKQKKTIADYSMHSQYGLNLTDPIVKDDPTFFGEETFRTITNWRLNEGKSNNKIQSYEWIINNNAIKINGTDNTFYAIDHIVKGGTNNITSENIKITDDTEEGKQFEDYYKYQKVSFIGVEMGSEEDGNTPILYQEKRRDAYLAKLNSKKLKVVMVEPNYGLNRGFMIQVSVFEYDRYLKSEMMKNAPNTSKQGDDSTDVPEKFDENTEILSNENIGILNTSISGMYFIDGMEFEYSDKSRKINQVLYLIKRDPSMSYLNAVSKQKIDNV